MRMFGYFAVDFLVAKANLKLQHQDNNSLNHQQPNHNNTEIFVIGVDCFYNTYTSAIMMIKQLTKVTYNKDSNAFVRITDLSNFNNISIQSSRISK